MEGPPPKAGFVVKINFFTPGLQFQASLSITHRYAWSWIFLKVGFRLETLAKKFTKPTEQIVDWP
jgi:hypothetical protein